jgi:hypothetical protein
MGAKLVSYYQYAARKGGLPLQMKLAMKTGMSQPKAMEQADTPEALKTFYTVMKELAGNDPEIPMP